MIDNTTTDWFPLEGREENGWTSIQFKRLLDTCDTMDVPIKVSTNFVSSLINAIFILVWNEYNYICIWHCRS